MTSTAVRIGQQAEPADQARENGAKRGGTPGQALGRQAQTPVRPGFEAIPPEVRPVGYRKPVARAAEPLAPAGRVASTADWLNARYGDLPSYALLESVVYRLFPGRVAAVSAFGAESAVLLAMVARVAPDLPIVFLDTDQHFRETSAYRDALVARLGLTGLRVVRPDPVHLAAADQDGALWSRDPDYCCHLRKVLPLESALQGFDAWISGRKRHHGAERSGVEVFETLDGRIQVNPLAHWSRVQIADAFDNLGLPPHPLVAAGYPSIGCAPCTRKALCAGPPRSGRWAGTGKRECGIHRARTTNARAEFAQS